MLLSYGLQAHTNVHILYYPLKTGEGVLQSIVFFSFYNIYKMNFLRGQETANQPIIVRHLCRPAI